MQRYPLAKLSLLWVHGSFPHRTVLIPIKNSSSIPLNSAEELVRFGILFNAQGNVNKVDETKMNISSSPVKKVNEEENALRFQLDPKLASPMMMQKRLISSPSPSSSPYSSISPSYIPNMIKHTIHNMKHFTSNSTTSANDDDRRQQYQQNSNINGTKIMLSKDQYHVYSNCGSMERTANSTFSSSIDGGDHHCDETITQHPRGDFVHVNLSSSSTDPKGQSSQQVPLLQRTLSSLSNTLSQLTSCGSSAASVANCSFATAATHTVWDDEEEEEIRKSKINQNAQQHAQDLERLRNNLQQNMYLNSSMHKVVKQHCLNLDEDDYFIIPSDTNTVRHVSGVKILEQQPQLMEKDHPNNKNSIKSEQPQDKKSKAHHCNHIEQTQQCKTEPNNSPKQYFCDETSKSSPLVNHNHPSFHQELEGTYANYRVTQKHIDTILPLVDTMFPPAHVQITKDNHKKKLYNTTSEPHGNTFMVR